MSLTAKGIEYLRCIHATWLQDRRAPAYRALGAHFGVSHVTAFEHVAGLKEKWYLDAQMRPTAKANHVLAGTPIAADVWAELLQIIGSALPCRVCGQEVFAIRRKGSGMVYVSGNTAMVHPCSEEPVKTHVKPSKRRKRRKGD